MRTASMQRETMAQTRLPNKWTTTLKALGTEVQSEGTAQHDSTLMGRLNSS